MKTNIKTILMAVLTLAIGFTSCKKDKKNSPAPDKGYTGEPRLMQLDMGANGRVMFSYNTEGLLNFYNFKIGNYGEEFHFGYEAGTKKPINGVYDNSLEIFFVYKDAKLDKVEYRVRGNAQNPMVTYDQYFYTGDKVSYKISYVKSEGGDLEPTNKTSYTYDANGDVKTETRSYRSEADIYVMTSRIEYQYDDKVNALLIPAEIYYVLNLPKSAHNIKTSKTYNMDDELDETKNYSLNYNAFNQPTTGVENTTYPNSPAINKSIKYYYQ